MIKVKIMFRKVKAWLDRKDLESSNPELVRWFDEQMKRSSSIRF